MCVFVCVFVCVFAFFSDISKPILTPFGTQLLFDPGKVILWSLPLSRLNLNHRVSISLVEHDAATHFKE